MVDLRLADLRVRLFRTGGARQGGEDVRICGEILRNGGFVTVFQWFASMAGVLR